MTAAVVNEVLERRQRERWSVLAEYALFELVLAARPRGAGGSESVRNTPRLGAAVDEILASVDRHVELYSPLDWWGSVLDESEPLKSLWAGRG